GRFLIHPSPGRAFAWDLGVPGGEWDDDLAGTWSQAERPRVLGSADQGDLLVGWATAAPDPTWIGGERWTMAVTRPVDLGVAPLRGPRLLNLAGIAAAVVITIVAIGLIARRMLAPLAQLSEAVSAFGRDGSDVPIPPSRIREIADLGADIAAMRAAILDQRTAL